jgi:hypothetical protein
MPQGEAADRPRGPRGYNAAMKRALPLWLTVGLVLAAPAFAQTGAPPANVAANLEYTRDTLRTQRNFIVGGSLGLTDAEAKPFWPIYEAYHKEVDRLDDRDAQLIEQYLRLGAGVSDEQARRMLEESMAVRESRLVLRRKYLKRFGEVLAPRKLVLYMQIEGKLDAMVAADLARSVPLLK